MMPVEYRDVSSDGTEIVSHVYLDHLAAVQRARIARAMNERPGPANVGAGAARKPELKVIAGTAKRRATG